MSILDRSDPLASRRAAGRGSSPRHRAGTARTGATGPAAASAVLGAVLLLAAVGPLRGQAPSPEALADSLESGVTSAFMRGDTTRLRELRRLADRAVTVHPDDPWLLHYRGYALYRLGTLLLGRDEDRADRLLERAQEAFERSARRDSLADSFALLSSTLGMRISVNPMVRGMTMGPESGEHLETALEVAPENPRVWLVRGISALNTPAMFGGSDEEAVRHLEKALSLFHDDSASAPAPGWGRAETYAWLGQAYAELGRLQRARAAYRDALRVEPDFGWVSQRLLPELEAVEGSG